MLNTKAALKFLNRTAEDIIEIGRDLIAQKKALGHGNFLPWIDAEFGMSEQTARNMMHVANTFGANPSRVKDLTSTALYLLAAPSTPEPVRQELLARADKGESLPPCVLLLRSKAD